MRKRLFVLFPVIRIHNLVPHPAQLLRSLPIVAVLLTLAAPAAAQLFGPAFNTSATGDVNTIAVQADGKVLLGGAFTQVNAVTHSRLARVNADGSLDATFTASITTGSRPA